MGHYALDAAKGEDHVALEGVAHEIRELLSGYPMPGWAPTP